MDLLSLHLKLTYLPETIFFGKFWTKHLSPLPMKLANAPFSFLAFWLKFENQQMLTKGPSVRLRSLHSSFFLWSWHLKFWLPWETSILVFTFLVLRDCPKLWATPWCFAQTSKKKLDRNLVFAQCSSLLCRILVQALAANIF